MKESEIIDVTALAEDAQQIHIESPDTFYAPPHHELDELKEGSIVKICVERERFWTIIKEIDGDKIKAEVNNHLIGSDEHNIYFEDIVSFEKRHIYQIH